MRVLAIHSSNDMYGSDRVFLQSLIALHQDGHEITAWLPADAPAGVTSLAEELERRGIEVRVLEMPVFRRRYLTPRGALGLARRSVVSIRALRQGQFDAVYLGTSALAPLSVLARIFTSARILVHVQELWTGAEGRILGWLLETAHHRVAISESVKESTGHRSSKNTTVVVNAVVDPGRVDPPRPKRELTFLVASRWNAWKGHDVLLAAWQHARPAGSTLLIAGAPPALGESFDVRAAVAALPDPASATVVGEVADISDLITAADVVIVPSSSPEPFGLVAAEAFALSRPVIASDAGGLADVVTSGVNGYLFPIGDAVALSDALISATRADLEAMGRAARATYDERFGMARYHDEFLKAWMRSMPRAR
ncbi:glycosyltransferase family 4 protein [Aeromicrobium sp.]|uniref:glycosyltransferase family 4 protein n=1 Tax=Aeromicrobium sp. TaxID=1871063 RepID=UPI003515B593